MYYELEDITTPKKSPAGLTHMPAKLSPQLHASKPIPPLTCLQNYAPHPC